MGYWIDRAMAGTITTGELSIFAFAMFILVILPSILFTSVALGIKRRDESISPEEKEKELEEEANRREADLLRERNLASQDPTYVLRERTRMRREEREMRGYND